MKTINKKGASRAVGIAFTVLIVAVLGGIIFGTDGLNSTTLTSNAPAWVVTLLTVGAGVALVRLVMRR